MILGTIENCDYFHIQHNGRDIQHPLNPASGMKKPEKDAIIPFAPWKARGLIHRYLKFRHSAEQEILTSSLFSSIKGSDPGKAIGGKRCLFVLVGCL
jgi:hypothetical protein